MSYTLAAAMTVGHGVRGVELDMTNSVLRLSPRVRHDGIRHWTGGGETSDTRRNHGGSTGAHPTAHQVVSAWGGLTRPIAAAAATGDRTDAASKTYGKSHSEQPLLLPRRTDRPRATNRDRRPLGRNVKLVFLKDSTAEAKAKFIR